MSGIEAMTNDRPAVDRLIGHLQLRREAPTLDYLHRLIREHQLRVPFETLTKLIDYEPGLRRGDFMPPMSDYVERIITRGGGGLCWTLARGLQVVLDDLGFDASLMYMDPGHCCVRVELPEGPFYADVGYAAPIFRAYPLFESFALDTHREKFEYSVRPDGIFVARNPGPSKKLDPTPRRLEDLRDFVTSANDWSAPQSFLHRLVYARYVGDVYTTLRDGTLSRYLTGGVEKTALTTEEVPAVMADVFGADPEIYIEAAEVHRRYSGASGSRVARS
jgi:arylamine N-acetyltransferase